MSENELFYAPKNGYLRISDAEKQAMEHIVRTIWRLWTRPRWSVRLWPRLSGRRRPAGFVPFEPGMELKAGDKIYQVNRNKSVIFAVIGRQVCPMERILLRPISTHRGWI